MDLNEKRFESDIEEYLIRKGGYIKGVQSYYDREKAIDMTVMLAFICKTQPKEWKRYEHTYQNEAVKMLYKRFQDEVEAKGLIHVLRNGVKDRGITLRFAYFAPSSALNEDLVEKYNSNILECHRQFAYSKDNSNTVDMVLSLNGIPIVALELKNQLTGQSVENGKLQYMNDRDPKELLFHFNKRVLVYFTADLTEVWMTTRLQKSDTRFLPFNQGSNGAGEVGGAGNPPNPNGYVTSYLWEKVLTKDSLMSILQRYISLEGKDKIIFPRYHQLDVVEKLVTDSKESGSGKNYLIQHSAGSGKSNSIAWLTYRLASLHNEKDEAIFDSVFVVTDRRILNRQLQDTINGFDHKDGFVVSITDDTPSEKLAEAITNGKKVIIATLHRFPIIYNETERQKGKRFAIIVDEAHSSQTGTSARKMKELLADTEEALKEYAEIEGKAEEEILDEEDKLVEQLLKQGQHSNLSFFAFTATPKPKTIDYFGIKQPDGQKRAFHIYSMRQAVEEGFILDVLRYYTTVQNSYEVVKSIANNPMMTEVPTMDAIKKYQKGHWDTIDKKVEMIVEKFREVTLTKINGQAKAMVVTASRAHAVKYYQEIKKYVKEKGYDGVRPLVAFSGELKIGDAKYTETSLNSTDEVKISERQLPEYFDSDEYNILVVADKYQTGFDQPKLHTMFVDKGLHGVKAVQTLSRLNRIYKGKIDTFVLDFVNTKETILKSFQPFYEETFLSHSIDVNLVYKFKDKVDSFNLWNVEDVEKFCKIYFKDSELTESERGKLGSIVKPATERYNQCTEEQRYEIRDAVRGFNRCYSYVIQIVRLFDKELHKFYLFSEYFARLIPNEQREIIDIDEKIKLLHNQLNETFSGSIELKPSKEDKTMQPEGDGKAKMKPKKQELLENIIEKINIMFEGKFTEADRVIVETIYDRLIENSKRLTKQAKNTDSKMFVETIFPEEFEKVAQKCYVDQMGAFSKLFETPAFYKKVMEQMAQAMYASLRNRKDAI